MLFKTVKEAATEWGKSERRIHTLCNEGRVDGAQKDCWSMAVAKSCKEPVKLKPGRKNKEQ